MIGLPDRKIARRAMPSRARYSRERGRVRQQPVADVVDQLAVLLLRHAPVEAAVARLHVEDRDVVAGGGYRRQAAVGVAEDEQRIGTEVQQLGLAARDDRRDLRAHVSPRGCRDRCPARGAQLVEEDLRELGVVVLPGVDEAMLDPRLRERLEDETQPDQLRPRPDDCHDLHGEGEIHEVSLRQEIGQLLALHHRVRRRVLTGYRAARRCPARAPEAGAGSRSGRRARTSGAPPPRRRGSRGSSRLAGSP